MVRVAHHLALCVALGSVLLLWFRAQQLSAQATRTLNRLTRLALVAALAATMLLMGSHGEVLLPEAEIATRIAAAFKTWIGQIIALQGLLAAAALLSIWLIRWHWVTCVLVCASAVLTALRSHVIAADDAGTLSIAALIHVATAVLWLSALVALLLMSSAPGRASGVDWRASLQAISRWALPSMLLLLATGILLADRTVATGAALVATPYGIALMFKLLMVVGALCCAWRLRRWLMQPNVMPVVAAVRWLRVESGFAGMVLLFAGLIAITIPAAHDTIHWPFSFRIAPVAAYLQRGPEILWLPFLGAVLLLLALWLSLRLRQHSLRHALLIGGGGVLCAVGLSVPALSVDAYPSTYLHSPIPYDAPSVQVGAGHYRQWCVSCHGVHGRGDGPLASTLPKPPANLTEPHVQWHTHGDLYWWITHGIVASGMPGFSQQLTDDERWQLLNFLTAMSMGYEARTLLPRISPEDPWLPAIDFRYADASGESISLSTWREQGKRVLLHFTHDLASLRVVATDDAKCVIVLTAPATTAASTGPMTATAASTPSSTAPGTITKPATSASIVATNARCDVVRDSDAQIAAAWAHYRRTLSDPDFKNEQVNVNGMRFLIDRFGFVRARWAADEPAPDTTQLKHMLTQLMHEPEIRSADIHARR